MSRVNDSWFGPGALAAALGGLDRESAGWPSYNGGIVNATRGHLAVEHKYYRFADSQWSKERQFFGGWWIDFEGLTKIKSFASEHSDPRDAVRYLLALPWEWNAADKIIWGTLKEPLDAYGGYGRIVGTHQNSHDGSHPRDKGARYIPPQQEQYMVRQFYIPGLLDIGNVFCQPRIEDIWTFFKR